MKKKESKAQFALEAAPSKPFFAPNQRFDCSLLSIT